MTDTDTHDSNTEAQTHRESQAEKEINRGARLHREKGYKYL